MALVAASVAWGFVFIKDNGGYVNTWFPGTIPMQVKLATSPALSDGTSLSASVLQAMIDWNAQLGVVQFSGQQLGPGAYSNGNDINEIVMDSTVDGEAFGENTLAVTVSWRSGNERTESDIVFNTKWTWDSYRGNLQGPEDIRRVAIHELGHVLGLDHPDQAGQSRVAIMNSTASDIDGLRGDDINGGQALYGVPGVTPANDNFANAISINVNNGTTQMNGTNVAATAEAGEPSNAGEPARRTVWWKWSAPGPGTMTVTTLGSNFDTVLGVHTGSSISGLTTLAFNDDVQSGVVRTSSVTLNGTGGTTYYIAVDGWDGYFGTIALNFTYTVSTVAPSLTSHPSNRTVITGQLADFNASASGAPNPTFQWQRLAAGSGNWVNLSEGSGYSGVNSGALRVSTTLAMSGDQFRAVATNVAGSATSNAALLTVNSVPPPVIIAQPLDRTVFVNMRTGVGVSATGATGYQWYKNGVLMPGQTQNYIIFTTVQISDAGGYHVVVSNAGGSVTSQSGTIAVRPVTGVVAIKTSPDNAMFMHSDGSRWVAGYDNWDMGESLNSHLLRPTALIPTSTETAGEFYVAAAALGHRHNLFINVAGQLWAQGENTYGQLGDGTTNYRSAPILVTGDVVAIAADRVSSVFLKSDGTLWGMGRNDAGQLGDGTTTDRSTPVQIAQSVRAVSMFARHVMFIKFDNTLWGIGNNLFAQMGDGTTTNRSTPVQVASDVVSAVAGEYCSFFIKSDGTLWGMGNNSFGQLGDGTTTNRSTPILITSNVADVAAGLNLTLILKTDGSLWYTGAGNGQFGTAYLSNITTPAQVDANVVTIASGDSCSYYLKADGSLWVTGYNQYGKLGLGDEINAVTPESLPNAAPAIPSQPAGVAAGEIGSSRRMLVSWRAAVGATSYEVWRHISNDRESAVRIASNVQTPLYYDTTVTSGTYYYWIRAVNPAGTSSFSSVGSGSIAEPTAPAIATYPSNLSVTAPSSASFTVVATGYPAPTYQWQRLPAGGSVWSNISPLEIFTPGSSSSSPYSGHTTQKLNVVTSVTMDGDQFRCVVANALGTVTSDSAMLTVLEPVPAGDFTGDGKSDLVWTNTVTGERYIWGMNGTAYQNSVYVGNLGADWRIAATGDFNADGKADLVWQNLTSGDRYIWLMNGGTMASSIYLGSVGTDWQIAAAADFNNDGKGDLVFQNAQTGDCYVWVMNGTAYVSSIFVGNIGAQWQVVAAGDFNADGWADVVLQNPVTGEKRLWLLDGGAFAASLTLSNAEAVWRIAGGGDFNADGFGDLVVHNHSTGERQFWLMNGAIVSRQVSLGILGLDWSASGLPSAASTVASDFNADGKSDLVWTNSTNGDRFVWLMNGTTMSSSVYLGNIGTSWRISGHGDFNADGKADLIWTNSATGDRYAWLMNGTTMSSSVYLGTIGTSWQISGIGDFNADGKSDLIWTNSGTGDRYAWLMNGTTMSSSVYLGTVGTVWQIAGVGDFNADGKSDLLWHNTANGDRFIWLKNGTTMSSSVYLGNIGNNWVVDATGDFNADGKSDLVWTNSSNGDRFVWLMNGTTMSSSVYLGNIGLVWQIQN